MPERYCGAWKISHYENGTLGLRQTDTHHNTKERRR
jgi:hypothetical protein